MDPRAFNGWHKTLADGTCIVGTDYDVDAGQVSWRKTSLDNLINVGLSEASTVGLLTADISGNGNFWHSDDLMAPMHLNQTVKGTRVKRRIEKQFSSQDKFIYVLHESTRLDIFVEEHKCQTHIDHGYKQGELRPEYAGQWLILEMDLTESKLKWYINPEMI